MRRLAALALLAALTGCSGISDTGGGGDTSGVGFSRGIAYVKSGDIWVADASDYEGRTQRLTTDQGNSQPALSRDGKLVAYVHTDATGASAIFSVPTGGGAASPLVPSSSRLYSGLCWAPDRSKLFYAADHLLWSVNADGSGETQLTSSSADVHSPSITSNGTIYALDLVQGGFVQVSGGNASLVYPAPAASRGAISPSGGQLAYEDAQQHEIFVFDGPGAAPRQLTSISGGQQREPAWSSDGSTIFFTSNAGGDDKIYSVAASATSSSGTLIQVGSEPSYGG